jgi:hypothetical protein
VGAVAARVSVPAPPTNQDGLCRVQGLEMRGEGVGGSGIRVCSLTCRVQILGLRVQRVAAPTNPGGASLYYSRA